MSALAGDAEFFRDVSDGSTVENDSLDEQDPPANGQTGINVGQENLLAVADFNISTKPGGSPFSQDPKCHQRHGRVHLVAAANRGAPVFATFGTQRINDHWARPIFGLAQ